MEISVIIVVVIVTALAFDFTNGFHDTANAVATSIATGALKPRTAVLMAGILNLVGAFLSVQVAKTISSGLVDEAQITPTVIFAGLVGAIVWNLLTWLLGLPSSSSHALIGGLIGATWVAAGADAVKFASLVGKVLLPAVLAPIIAGVIALIATYLAYRITARGAKGTVTKGFKLGQIVSASMVSLAHGTNDAQKTMGVITLTLIIAGVQSPSQTAPELWVILACGITIALGTYMGGWRIIRTLGKGLTDVKPAQGFSAESSTAATILSSSALGFALSTTQVASGSVIGSGLGRRGATVRWRTAGRIMVGWLFTLPASAAVGGVMAVMVAWLGGWGILIDAVFAVVVILTIFLLSRRNAVTAANAMSEVAESGTAVKVTRNPPPTRRQRAAVRDEARREKEGSK